MRWKTRQRQQCFTKMRLFCHFFHFVWQKKKERDEKEKIWKCYINIERLFEIMSRKSWQSAGFSPHYPVQSSNPWTHLGCCSLTTISSRCVCLNSLKSVRRWDGQKTSPTVNKSHKPCGYFSENSFPVWLKFHVASQFPMQRQAGDENVKTKL